MSALSGVDSRAAQDVLLRLLADGPFRTAALAGVLGEGLAPGVYSAIDICDPQPTVTGIIGSPVSTEQSMTLQDNSQNGVLRLESADFSLFVTAKDASDSVSTRQVIRFAPPLVISREEADWALERIAQVLG